MYFKNINTYTNPGLRNTERSSDVNTSNSRSSRNKGNQQKTCGLLPQNNEFLTGLMQMVQNLLKQLQPKQDASQGVNLSGVQRQNIATTLGVNSESINVVDADKDGTVSMGDQIKATYTTDTGGTELLSRTVDAGFALDINGKLGTPLDMGAVGLAERITKHLGISNGVFRDQDGSGSLSAGDVIKSVSYDQGGQGTPSYYTLTAENMQSLRDTGIYPLVGGTDTGNPSPLNKINDQQHANILLLFKDAITQDLIDHAKANGFVRPYIISDDDGSGSITVGDRLLTGSRIDGNFQEHTLTADEVGVINGGDTSN